MREIKFRAWVDGGMVYKGGFENWEITLDGKIHFYQNCHEGEFGNDAYILGEDIQLMQYTGLKDKNGKEIYESDIVKNKDRIGKIVWKEFGWQTEYPKELNVFYLLDWYELEVIGNIYENPELLKGV